VGTLGRCSVSAEADGYKHDRTYDRLGLRCPTEVFEEVEREAASSAFGRRAAVKAKDTRDIEKARNAILRLFPQIPLATCQAVLDHGFQKGSGRVGRSTVLDDDQKVTLAIVAHVRHTMTPYDILLRELDRDGVGEETRRETARGMIRGRVDDVLKQWRSSSTNIVLKPIKERPKVRPAKGKNPPVQSRRAVSSGRRGPPDTKLEKSEKGAATTSLEASIHAVRSKPKGSLNTNLPRTAPVTRRTSRTIPKEVATSTVSRGPAGTRGRGSRGGFSTAHMTTSLEASIHAPGFLNRSCQETNEVSTQSFHAAHMTFPNSLNESIHAVKYTFEAEPAMTIGTRSKSSNNHVFDILQKKRSHEVDEGTPKAKRTKCDKATPGTLDDIQACRASTTARMSTATLDYVDDDNQLPLVLDAMRLDEAAVGSQNMFHGARPFPPHKCTSRKTANIPKGNPMTNPGRLKHPTRRQLSEIKNGIFPMTN
jgi:hypothetical protein